MRSPVSRSGPFLLFAVVFAVHALSPRTASGDSRWTVPEALSILDRGDANLDEYPDLMRRNQYYAIECVGPTGRVAGPAGGPCAGHYYNMFPVAVPAVAVPFVLLLRALVPILAAGIPKAISAAHPELVALTSGDFVTAHAVVEEWIASFFVALTAVVIYAIARRYLRPSWSMLLAFVFAFATPAWSSGSRAFGQHAPSAFAIALTLYIFLTAEDRPRLARYAGLTAAAAYAFRPTNSLLVILATAYILERHRKQFHWYLLWALPVAAPFLAYNLVVYHSVFSPYFAQHPPPPLSIGLIGRIGAAFAGQLLSPSRGVLIFTPLLIFSIRGMVLACRRRWQWPLSRYLIWWTVVHWIVISLYVEFWWAGHSYGPRWFTDLMPVFVFFLIPVIQSWENATPRRRCAETAAFCVLVAASGFIHARGACSLSVQNWNGSPQDVDRNPSRVWDWSDPQFLR